MRPYPALAALLLAAGAAAGCGDFVDIPGPAPTGCHFGGGEDPLHLTSEQTFNAATIAAVGQREGMDEQAVAVAIATAFQESGLSNVDYGHHDSLGLFQQRPSVGWGTEEEILDPVYASFKFYEKLQRTDGWQEMPIGDAAQAVQVSAYPDLYDQWVEDALVIASVLAGGEESGLRCIGEKTADAEGEAASLAEAYAYQWGGEADGVDGRTVAITAGEDGAAWNQASWAVAKSWQYPIAAVEYGGMRWEPGEDGWTAPGGGEATEVAVSDPNVVMVTLHPED